MPEIEKNDREMALSIVRDLKESRIARGVNDLRSFKDEVYAAIPDKKRISRGITWVVETVASELSAVCESNAEIKELAEALYENIPDGDRLLGVPIYMMANFGINDPEGIFDFFSRSANSDDWVVREFSQGAFRRVIRPNKELVINWLGQVAQNESPYLRRFTSETLRPVADNRWIQNEPETSLQVLRKLFKETHKYPRTSVGNNLSDLARHNPELVYELVKALVACGDKNSYWIAERACRNLVKSDPMRVLDALGVDEYHYKDRHFTRDQSRE